jgi:hypothetical protein
MRLSENEVFLFNITDEIFPRGEDRRRHGMDYYTNNKRAGAREFHRQGDLIFGKIQPLTSH